MKLATIDIGTNSAKILIIEVDPISKSFTPLKEDLCLSRLGEGWQGDRVLKPVAIQRTIDGLLRFKSLAEGYGVSSFFVAATMCVREAKNQKDFLDRVEAETGWSVWVMTGEEEAETSYRGARTVFPHLTEPVVALDIGGGSTEWIFDPLKSGVAPFLKSLPLGSVQVTEQFLPQHPPSENQLKTAREFARKQFLSLDESHRKRAVHFIGIGGTVVSISLMIQPSGKLNPISKQDLTQLIERISKLTVQERLMQFPKLEKGRADVILAGALILETAMEVSGLTECLVSNRGLRFGLIPEQF